MNTETKMNNYFLKILYLSKKSCGGRSETSLAAANDCLQKMRPTRIDLFARAGKSYWWEQFEKVKNTGQLADGKHRKKTSLVIDSLFT